MVYEMMFKLHIRAISENNVEGSLGVGYGVRFRNMTVIIVVDDTRILRRQVRIHVYRLSKGIETHRICNIATTNTLGEKNDSLFHK